MKDFRSYQLSIEFYKQCRIVKLPHFIKDQLLRAASSIQLVKQLDSLAVHVYRLLERT